MAVKEKAREAGEKTLETLGTAAERGKDVIGTAAERGKDVLGTAAGRGKDVLETATERAKEYTPKRIRKRREKQRRRERRRSMLKGLGVGLAVGYFFDPDNGKRRRNIARDRVMALFRTGAQRGARLGRYAASQTYGAVQKARHAGPDAPPENDATLARKVESEVLGNSPLKGKVSVNAERGVVVLRGEIERPDDIRDLEGRVRSVSGVQDVRNLLHTPGTPAPGRTTTG